MALIHMNYFSAALGKMSALSAVVPQMPAGRMAVIYQLHGFSDDYTAWQRRTSLERYADRYGVMVVMLDGGRSFYCDLPRGLGNYEQHVLQTVELIDHTFATAAEPSGRGIGGLSMGGYGAVKLGLKYPDLFGSVAAHSGALDLAAIGHEEIPEVGLLTADLDPGNDCFALASRPGAKPALYFDCGLDDFLLEHNRRFHAHLDALGIAHSYAEHPGSHSWEYWDEHVETALRFHRQHLAHDLFTGS